MGGGQRGPSHGGRALFAAAPRHRAPLAMPGAAVQHCTRAGVHARVHARVHTSVYRPRYDMTSVLSSV